MKNNILIFFLLSLPFFLFSTSIEKPVNNSYVMCETTSVITEDAGTLFDSGGEIGNYSSNENCFILLDLDCAEIIEFDVTSFNLETCCDVLRIYDGSSNQDELIYSNDGTGIFETGGTALVTFTSDGSVTSTGFEISFLNTTSTNNDPINTNFFVTNNPILNHPTQFTDLSSPEPTSWEWDFGDGVKSTIQNPIHIYQNPGEYIVQLISSNCSFSDTLSKTINVQDSPSLSIDPQSINLTLNCGIDTTVSITVTNNSMENDGFIEVFKNNDLFENITMEKTLQFTGQNHDFSFVPENLDNLDSFSMEVIVNGDYSATSEFADIYIEGELVGTIGEGVQMDGADITKVFTFSIEIVEQWLSDGIIDIHVDNSTAVNFLSNTANSTIINMFLGQNIISKISDLELVVEENSSAELEVFISTDNLVNGVYDESFFITTNDINNSAFMISLIINVEGQGLIDFPDDCLDFGVVQQFNSLTLPFTLENTGCTNLNIQNISFSNTELSTNEMSFNIEAFENNTIDIQYSPSSQYSGTDTIYVLTNNGTFSHCIQLESEYAPSAIIEPVQITLACNQDTLIDIPFINIGLGDLDFLINSIDEYEDSDVINFNFNDSEYPFTFSNYPLFNDLTVNIRIDDLIVDDDEYVDVFIEGNFVERLIDLSTQLNVFEFSFNGQEAISMLQDGQVNVVLVTAENVSGFTTANFEVTVSSTELISDEFTSFQSTVAANDTFINQVTISSSPFVAGDYTFNYFITTNDPFNPIINLPIHLTVADVPTLELNTDCFELGTIFQFQTIEETIIISNPSCAPLNITEVTGSNEDIIIDNTILTIQPFSSDSIILNFTEDNITDIDENIVISSNAGLDTICISGITELPPVITVNPASFDVDVAACFDSVTVQVEIENTGDNRLDFEIVSQDISPFVTEIEDLKSIFNDNIDDFSAQIDNKFAFLDGIFGSSIADGGSDMYDFGNILNTTNFSNILYSNDEISILESESNTVSYFTLKQNDLFVFGGNLSNEDEFFINGFLGADGSGLFNGGELDISNNSYKAFYKQVYNSFDPSVNHLIIVNSDSNNNIIQTLPTTTNSDLHEISNIGTNATIIYVLFAGESSFEYDEAVFQDLANEIISHISSNTSSSSNINVGSLEPTETTSLEVTFYSRNLTEGAYNDTILINSNDPVNSILKIPVVLNVDETLCNLEIISNVEGCSGFVNFTPSFFNEATTYDWDFGDGNTSSLSNPVHFYENTGSFDVTLTISNDISSITETEQVTIGQNNGPRLACEVSGSSNNPSNGIVHFQLGDIDSETTAVTGTYFDFSCTEFTTLIKGETYQYSIEIEFGFNDDAIVLLDYNNNGIFEEFEQISSGNSGNSQFITETFTVPENALLDTPLRLRIISDPVSSSFSPCSTTFGEAEDYTVIIETNEQAPIVEFDTETIDACAGTFQFIDQSTLSPNTYFWDFGDGNNSTIKDPIHTYDSSGIFTVSLTATNDFGSQTIEKQILSNALSPKINVLSQALEANMPIIMEAIGENVTTWFWDFGNGETSNNQIASTIYDVNGSYVINLTGVNSIGCQRTISQIIHIGIVSTEEIDQSLKVYPNPTTHGFYIENLSNKNIKSIRLVDGSSKVYLEQFLSSNNLNQELYIEKGDVPSGFYQLIMEFEDGNTVSKKIIFIE